MFDLQEYLCMLFMYSTMEVSMIYCACGYCGTGSSVIYHLLSEYDGIESGDLGDYEHVLMYTHNGVFDLEDHMLRNNGWHNFDAAIMAFREEMMRLNDNDFKWFGGFKARYGNQFETILNEYINNLTQYTLHGYWSYDMKGYKFDSVQFAKDMVRKAQGKERPNPGIVIDRAKDNDIYYSFLSEEEFYKYSSEFVNKYLKMMYGDAEKINVNQFLVPHNLFRIGNYFGNNLKSVIVDRDPRDLYIITKYVWPTKGIRTRFPMNVDDFCTFYEGMRKTVRPYDPNLVITMQFEDFVYKYDETVAKVEEFFGLDLKDHVRPKTHLNPAVSIANTQNFLIRPEWEEEVKPIAERLSQYLYDYPYVYKPDLKDTKFL